MEKSLGFETKDIAPYVSLYWASLMIGRWTGAVEAFDFNAGIKKILRFLAPYLAFGVFLLVNAIAKHDLSHFYIYGVIILVMIVCDILSKGNPARMLLIFSVMGILATVIGMLTSGMTSVYAFTSVGLFCSTLWPCIFALAINGLGKHTNQGSGYLTVSYTHLDVYKRQGDNAFLVTNVPNKIEIVNRYTFKKTGTITANLNEARYIAFSGNNTYVTNNNFFDVRKVNIYDNSNAFVKSINFDRYAEKIVSADGFVYVQTDGVTYDANYNELPTGHTISRINPATNNVDKTITLTDDTIIRDMIADNSNVYVLSSDYSNSYIYKIDAKTGTAAQTKLAGVSGALKLAVDNGKIYFLTSGKKLYSYNGTAATAMFDVTTSNVYGFNVIDDKVFVSDPSFSKDNDVRIYNLSGNLLKTITTCLLYTSRCV